MIKFEVGKSYYFNGHMSTMFGDCIDRDTLGMTDFVVFRFPEEGLFYKCFVDYPNDEFENRETVFFNWHDKLYASDSRWWAK